MSYEARVNAITEGARERTTRLTSEVRDEQARYRETAVQRAHQLQHELTKLPTETNPESGHNPPASHEPPSWADDDEDFSDKTWLR